VRVAEVVFAGRVWSDRNECAPRCLQHRQGSGPIGHVEGWDYLLVCGRRVALFAAKDGRDRAGQICE
jgi:hypothetical protein